MLLREMVAQSLLQLLALQSVS